MNLPPIILTLKFDDASSKFFNELRQKHFPPERNFLSAHITLFHHLPGEELAKIREDLREVCDRQSEFEIEFTEWRFLGKGSAMTAESVELNDLRGQLARTWADWLTRQDQQKFKPHITVQNKVAPDEAKDLFAKLSGDWEKRVGKAKGLLLWTYLGGHWKLENEFLFPDSF